MLAGSMPNFVTPSRFVDTATKCCRTARSSPSLRRHQTRAEWALANVSIVVKVLEETMNRVSSGARSRVPSTRSVPSTLETKRNVMWRRLTFRFVPNVDGTDLVEGTRDLAPEE